MDYAETDCNTEISEISLAAFLWILIGPRLEKPLISGISPNISLLWAAPETR